MAYDRYENRRGRFHDDDRDRGRRDERGFFERAGDEVASWFGDEDAERRRREDERMSRGWGRDRDFDRDRDHDRFAYRGSGRSWDRGRDEDSGQRSGNWRSGYAGYEHDFSPRGYGAMGVDRGYTPTYVGATGYTGGYGRYGYGAGSDRGYGSGGYGFSRFEDNDRRDSDRERGGIGRESDRSYEAWRQRQLNELDRDYDEYRREHQQQFERDFGNWRETRQKKRGMLSGIREDMEVVGSDGETIGKVDCVRGDHIVLTKSDSEDNRHHSITCSMIDSVEGDQVKLDIPAEEAKSRWDTIDKDRSLFGRDQENEVNLERSFAGTYR